MPLGMELDYRLRWMDFDKYGRIQPVAVLDIFQDLATIQAEDMGIGRDDMMAKGVFWAIVRSKFEIVKAPQHYQVVTVRTWPHTPTRFSFLRDFSMRDQEGELLVKATSEWVLMDAEARKFASVKDFYDGPDDFDEARSFDRKPRKIASFDEGSQPVFTVVPSYSDIDLNGHVNNARYASFVIDALNPGERGAMKTFQIDYRHEVLPGEPLAMHTLVENGLVLSKGVNAAGETAFACAIELA
ncbi:MAG: hypothetical protein IJ111_00065 [Eggerthellaceae bacterium]|nr:hypothetical protein [Eggerthellaceae bacterium]